MRSSVADILDSDLVSRPLSLSMSFLMRLHSSMRRSIHTSNGGFAMTARITTVLSWVAGAGGTAAKDAPGSIASNASRA